MTTNQPRGIREEFKQCKRKHKHEYNSSLGGWCVYCGDNFPCPCWGGKTVYCATHDPNHTHTWDEKGRCTGNGCAAMKKFWEEDHLED